MVEGVGEMVGWWTWASGSRTERVWLHGRNQPRVRTTCLPFGNQCGVCGGQVSPTDALRHRLFA
jgi:hypothetical protein